MVKRLPGMVLWLVVLVATGCAPYLVVRGGVVNADKIKEIKAGLAAMRGLDFKSDVPIEVKSEAEIRRYFAAELDREYGGEKLESLALVYGKLGLLPERYDLKKGALDFYSSQVAAFYDPRVKKLFIPEDLDSGMSVGLVQFLAQRDITGEMILAHELTHALQDQHFSLADRLAPSNNDDRTLAFRAVAEGDATLSGFGYVLGDLDDATLSQVEESVNGSIGEARALAADIPQAILEELLFQYYGGVSFVSRVLKERGWLGVSFLYRYPPVSTEQILHPERFLETADAPVKIALHGLAPLFSPEWKEIENNVLGEVMIRALFQRFIGERAGKVADGWGGDRLVAFRRGEEVALVWATVWDSVADAAEFYQGYGEVLTRKYAGGAAARAYIEQRDRRVIIVEGLAAGEVEKEIEKIWQGMALEAEPFNPFFARLRSKPAASP